jgi:RNA polymerase sigma-70 factor (ECF subfamily)
MPESKSVKGLVGRWQTGDAGAAEALHQRYAQRLWALAEAQIGSRLRRRVDPEDIVQSVFRTFFRRATDGQFVIDHSCSLWRLLVRITINKVRLRAQHHHAGKRDLAIEVYAGDEQLAPEAIARGPGPEEAAALADEIETLLRRLKPPEVEIFQLSLQGYATPEIAERLRCSRWTIRRTLDRIGHQFEHCSKKPGGD